MKTNSSGMDEKDLLQGVQGRDLTNQPLPRKLPASSRKNARFHLLESTSPNGGAALPHPLP